MYRDIPPELRALIEPVIQDHGCELVDAEIQIGHGGRASGLVRITLDSAAGDGRVPIDQCARVSREIESQLDATNAIPGRYRLEVSSPGLDRVLGREKDFEAALGQEVKLETKRPQDGRRRFRGVLRTFDGGVARIAVDGSEVEIAFEDVKKARTVYQFSREDFAGNAAD